MYRRIRVIFTVTVLATAGALMGECVDGAREATDVEKRFVVSTKASFRSALPASPEGWRLERRDEIVAPAMVCRGLESAPLYAGYTVEYAWIEAVRERNRMSREVETKAAALRALPPGRQRQWIAMNREAHNLLRQDLRRQAVEVGRGARLLQAEHQRSVEPQISRLRETIAGATPAKTYVRMTISANPVRTSVAGAVAHFGLPGASLALRAGDETVIYFGPVLFSTKKGRGGEYAEIQSVFQPGRPRTTVQIIAVRLKGDPEQVDALLTAFRLDSLAELAPVESTPFSRAGFSPDF